jgi:hypothetical protein
MVAGLTGVLRGEPAAIAMAQAGLRDARARAVAGLAFELAGQITAEIAALDWASQPQRVTGVAPESAVAIGWCQGVALRLEVRCGRLHRWEQRPGPPPVTRSPIAPGLLEFAATNAQLAANLLGLGAV